MKSTETTTTRLSTKGQLILPKAIRQRRKWEAGTRLSVEDTSDGVLINIAKPEPVFPPTRFADVAGCLKYDGPPMTLDDMDRAITAEVRARHARGRY